VMGLVLKISNVHCFNSSENDRMVIADIRNVNTHGAI